MRFDSKKPLALFSFVLTSLLSARAGAQNLRDVPLGGRTATMGGAGVAAGIDAAMPYLNPAGIAGTPYDVLSVSGNVYSALGASVPHALLPNGPGARYADVSPTDEGYSKKHLLTMPSALAYFKRFGDAEDPVRHTIALSLVAPSYEQEDITGTMRATGTVHRIGADLLGQSRYRQIMGGPSYAVSLGKRIRFGASLYASYSDLVSDTQQINFAADLASGGLSAQNSRVLMDAFSVGMSFVGGVQLQPIDDIWLGFAFESGGIPLYGGGTLKQTTDSFDAPNASSSAAASHTTQTGSFHGTRLSRPMRISYGLAYDLEHVFAIAADVHMIPGGQTFRSWSLDVGTSQLSTGSPYSETVSHVDYRRRTRATTDFSIGAEVWVTPTVSIRAGVLTDKDVAETQTLGEDRKNGRVDWTMYTLGVGHAIGLLGTTYGVAYRRGASVTYVNDVYGPSGGGTTEVPFTAHGVMLILAGSVRTDEEKKHKSPFP